MEPVNDPAETQTSDDPAPIDVLKDIEVEVTIEIGRRRMKVADFLKLRRGQTVSIAKSAGEPLDVLVNGQLVGRGEAVVVGDRYGVRITELVAGKGEGST